MGQCVSGGGGGAASQVTTTAAPPPPKATALVLLPEGELREYPRPATAARVLDDVALPAANKGWFLCDSDRMGFEGPVAAVGEAEQLRAGRIYFVLPAEARRRGLAREEVAALAVKASDALAARAAGSSSGNARRRRGGAAVAPLVFSPTEEDEDEDEDEEVIIDVARNKAAGKRRRSRSRRTHRRFAPDLTAIPECDMNE